jgi:predicted RNase H-like HicB family nuclease
MTTPHFYTVVFQHEDNGTVSAYMPDLPGVYASGDTLAGARRGIREALEGYLRAMRTRGWRVPARRAEVTVARVDVGAEGERVSLVGVGALLGRRTSSAKAATSRANGARGGRPRKTAA